MLLGSAEVRFVEAKAQVDVSRSMTLLAPIEQAAVPVDWQKAEEVPLDAAELEKEADESASFASLPAEAGKLRSYASWGRDLVTYLYGGQSVQLMKSPGLGEVSRPDEPERDFRARLQQAAREQRDQVAEKLRQKYAPKTAAIQERIRRAEQAVEREKEQAQHQGLQTAISVGATLLGAFLGRKAVGTATMGRAATAARAGSRAWKEKQDIARAGESVEALKQQLADLEGQFSQEIAALESAINPATESLESVVIKPKKTNITVRLVALAWAPYWQDNLGNVRPAYL
jgi:hypothetical protein